MGFARFAGGFFVDPLRLASGAPFFNAAGLVAVVTLFAVATEAFLAVSVRGRSVSGSAGGINATGLVGRAGTAAADFAGTRFVGVVPGPSTRRTCMKRRS